MNVARFIPIVGLVAFLAVSASAEERPKLELFASGGLATPLTPSFFKDSWKNGWGVGGGAAYRFNSRLAIEGRIDYDELAFDQAGFEDLVFGGIGIVPVDFGLGVEIEGADVSLLSFVGDVKFSIVGDDKRISPYVMGGGGIGRLATGETTIRTTFLPIYELYLDPAFFPFEDTIEGQSETAPLITFGAGVDFRASRRITIFVDGRYQRLFTEGEPTDHGSVRGGVRIGI
jgi:opacity protein-like surface antigen